MVQTSGALWQLSIGVVVGIAPRNTYIMYMYTYINCLCLKIVEFT